MADTAVAITAGTGTNIDTRTEGTNGNHRQVVVLGDPATNAGVAPVDATAGLKVDLGADNDVTVTGTVTVTGGSTLAEQQTQTTSLQLIDDVIVADDAAFTPATTKVAMAGFTFDDVAPDSVNEGDAGAARMSANRNIYTTIRDAAGNERGANVNASSQLSVSVDNTVTVGSHAVTNAGTFVVQENGAALTSLQLIDDTVFTDDTSTHTTAVTKGLGVMAVATPTDASVDANDMGMLAMTTSRNLKVDLAGSAANATAGLLSVKVDQTTPGTTNAIALSTLGANAVATGNGASSTGVLRVAQVNDGTGVLATVTNVATIGTSVTPGTAAANLGKAEDAAHTTGDVGVMALGVRADAGATGNPTALATTSLDYIPPAMDANNRMYVNSAGDLAHDAVDSTSNPQKIGGQARTTNPTAVADADRVNFIADKLGKQVVVGSIRDLKANQITTITSSTSETTVVTAVASTFMDVYGCIVVNSSATAANVSFKDSTAGTTRFNIYVPAGETRGFMLNESAAIAQTTVNNNWTATSSASVASLIITMLTVKNT